MTICATHSHTRCTVCQELVPSVYAVEEQYKGDVNFVMLNIENARWLLASSVHLAMPKLRNIKLLASDSAGMQAGHISS